MSPIIRIVVSEASTISSRGSTSPEKTADVSRLRTLGIDEALGRTDANSTLTYTYLTDALGSTIALADSSGSLPTTYTYAPFRETAVSGLPSASPVQFTGRENDGTGLYYYRARYYDPVRSRFIGEDPIGFEGGINAYRYVLDSPIGLTDPLGLDETFMDCGTARGRNGRYCADGPRNGNWGGKNWSGGWNPNQHGGQDGPGAPTDSADACYLAHD